MAVQNPTIIGSVPFSEFPVVYWTGTSWTINVTDPSTGDVTTQDSGEPVENDDVFLGGYLGSTPLAQSGSVPINGEYNVLSGNGGPWTLIGTATFTTIGEYTPTTFLTPSSSNVAADDVYIGGGSEVDLTNVGTAVTFDGTDAILGINAASANFTIDGFATGDDIIFTGQPGYNVSNSQGVLFGTGLTAGTFQLYGAPKKVADTINLSALSTATANLIYPVDYTNPDGSKGVELEEDATVPLTDPTAANILWSFIHANEGQNVLQPYWPKQNSGVTVATGVDLGNFGFQASTFATIFGTNWANDPNLRWLAGAIGLKGNAALNYITATQYSTPNKTATTDEVSITTSQGNELTTYVEQYLYTQLIREWDSTVVVRFEALSQPLATALYDVVYNFGTTVFTYKGVGYSWWDAAEEGNYAPLIHRLQKDVDNPDTQPGVVTRRMAEINDIESSPEYKATQTTPATQANLVSATISSAPLTSAANTDPTITTLATSATGAVSAPVSVGSEYAIGTAPNNAQAVPLNTGAPAGTFVFLENAGSALLSSIEMPGLDPGYNVSFHTAAGWTTFQTAGTDDVLTAPAGADGVQITILDANGNPIVPTGLEDFAFFPTFASSGAVSAQVYQEGVTNPLTGDPDPQLPQSPTIAHPSPGTTPGVPGPPVNNFTIVDTTSGQTSQAVGTPYSGPVSGLTSEFILPTTDQITVTANVPNVFIQIGGQDQPSPTLGGIDVSVANGNNVLDSYANSSFLTDGTGTDQNYLDTRALTQNQWDTVVNFHSGDNITLWGVTQADFNLDWIGDTQGATGFTGLTGVFVPTAANQPEAAVTLAGFKMADLTNGKLAITYDTINGTPYASIHAT